MLSTHSRILIRCCTAPHKRRRSLHLLTRPLLSSHAAAHKDEQLCQTRCFLTTTLKNNKSDNNNNNNNNNNILYESPLGKIVTKLRAVSLLSAAVGTIGLPLFVALKGMPPTGPLAFGLTFSAASLASTAGIHFVFSPYVYSLERIPIRVCHYDKEKKNDDNHDDDDTAVSSSSSLRKEASDTNNQDFLYKAVSKSLFLTRVETVFDPATDVIPYKGFYRPLCNFLVLQQQQGRRKPLYVHPEYVHSAALRQALQLPAPPPPEVARPVNPDDDFL